MAKQVRINDLPKTINKMVKEGKTITKCVKNGGAPGDYVRIHFIEEQEQEPNVIPFSHYFGLFLTASAVLVTFFGLLSIFF